MPIHDVNLAEVLDMDHEEPPTEAKLSALRTEIDKGDASGVADGDPFARIREAHKLLQPKR